MPPQHDKRIACSPSELPALRLAPPAWEHPPAELALDAGYHLVYGTAVAVAYAALRG